MRTASDKRGFMLIEIMIGVAIASFGLMVLTNLFARGYNANQYALEYTKAVLLARQKIEEFRFIPKDKLESLIMASKMPGDFKDSSGNFTDPGFKWSAAVVNRWRNLIEVEVDVAWGWAKGNGKGNYLTKHVRLNGYF